MNAHSTRNLVFVAFSGDGKILYFGSTRGTSQDVFASERKR